MKFRYSKYILFTLSLGVSPMAQASLRASEWGTFTSLQGSNGVVQSGMHHEEEALPPFVHGRDPLHESAISAPDHPLFPPGCHSFKCMEFDVTQEDRAGRISVTQKMETPVIYFYSDQAKQVEVEVGFPKGIISQYYPNPVEFAPGIGQVTSLSGGRVKFVADILMEHPPLPTVLSGNVYGPARNVPEANTLRSGGEVEKFIFYRGLGDFSTNFSATSKDGELSIHNGGASPMPAAFILNVSESGGNIISLGAIGASGQTVSKESFLALGSERLSRDAFQAKASRMIESALVKSANLTQEEAAAMVNTWKVSYFRTPGLRVLYLLSRNETDQILPLTIKPTPSTFNRALVGRVEILLDTEEKALLQKIQKEGSSFAIDGLGRFAEPKLRRLRELAPDDSLRSTIDTLLDRIP